jgi:hypothetical protein
VAGAGFVVLFTLLTRSSRRWQIAAFGWDHFSMSLLKAGASLNEWQYYRHPQKGEEARERLSSSRSDVISR